MTQTTGNSDSRVIEAVKHATDLNSRGETELAVRHLSALIEEFPTAASLRGYVALFLSQTGRFDEAIENGQQAILLSPGSEKASLVLFDALWKAGQHTKALDEMKRFLALGSSAEYSRMIKEWNLSEGGTQPS
jgi:tetratricopeptide (TPR) repeat protein